MAREVYLLEAEQLRSRLDHMVIHLGRLGVGANKDQVPLIVFHDNSLAHEAIGIEFGQAISANETLPSDFSSLRQDGFVNGTQLKATIIGSIASRLSTQSKPQEETEQYVIIPKTEVFNEFCTHYPQRVALDYALQNPDDTILRKYIFEAILLDEVRP